LPVCHVSPSSFQDVIDRTLKKPIETPHCQILKYLDVVNKRLNNGLIFEQQTISRGFKNVNY
jgi:hypothetical protein